MRASSRTPPPNTGIDDPGSRDPHPLPAPGTMRPASPLGLLGPTLLAGLLIPLLPPGGAGAQNVLVDQGTFLLSREGRAIGTERFTIRRTGSGPDARIIATAEVEIEVDARTRRVAPALEASARGMNALAYQVKVSGDRSSEIYMTLSGRRFQAKVMSPEGEELREFRAARTSVLLDEEVAHHYFFVAARIRDGTTTIPVVVPRAGRQMSLTGEDMGTKRVQIAGRTVHARHLRIQDGSAVREVWVDEEGRVLRVINHDTGYRAERRDLPG